MQQKLTNSTPNPPQAKHVASNGIARPCYSFVTAPRPGYRGNVTSVTTNRKIRLICGSDKLANTTHHKVTSSLPPPRHSKAGGGLTKVNNLCNHIINNQNVMTISTSALKPRLLTFSSPWGRQGGRLMSHAIFPLSPSRRGVRGSERWRGGFCKNECRPEYFIFPLSPPGRGAGRSERWREG